MRNRIPIKVLVGILVAVVLIGSMVGVVVAGQAEYTTGIGGRVEVFEPSSCCEVQLFKDEYCTIPYEEGERVHFGPMRQGETKTIPVFFVKNMGTETVDVWAEVKNLETGDATVWWQKRNFLGDWDTTGLTPYWPNVPPGGLVRLSVELTVTSSEPLGTEWFWIKVYAGDYY